MFSRSMVCAILLLTTATVVTSLGAEKKSATAPTATAPTAPSAASEVPLPPGPPGKPTAAFPRTADNIANMYTLDQFGAIDTVEHAQQTLETAINRLEAQDGATLVIPPRAPKLWMPSNHMQDAWRAPLAPAATLRWGSGPGVTIIDARGGNLNIIPPQITGLSLRRALKLPQDQSLGIWSYYSLIDLIDANVRGTSSYQERVLEDVSPGKDCKFFLPTIRGVFPGQTLSVGQANATQEIRIKSLQYDNASHRWFALADTDKPIAKGTLLVRKDQLTSLMGDTYSHNENQTFEFMIWRHDYSQGTKHLVNARLHYMGDNISTGGDHGSANFNATVESDIRPFRGTIASYDPVKRELIYRDGKNCDTLASGRPIINLNPQKIINDGTMWVSGPAGAVLGWGGSIHSTSPRWTKEIVGRYLAMDVPSEYLPRSDKVRRWFLISSFNEADGIKTISIVRHWWGAKQVGSFSQIYDYNDYTWDAKKIKELKYIIAPGAYVQDASDGVESTFVNAQGSKKLLRMSPGSTQNSNLDFAAGDPIEQAIGPDPFKPIVFRSWLFEHVPGAFPAAVFDIANWSPIQRATVLNISGGSGNLIQDRETRYDHSSPWGAMMTINAACNDGFVFNADTRDAAISFYPKWKPADPKNPGSEFLERYHAFDWTCMLLPKVQSHAYFYLNKRGMLVYASGHAVDLNSKSVTQLTGLSAKLVTDDTAPSQNLRGIKVPFTAGATTMEIKFPRPERDGQYVVVLRPSWFTEHAITAQTAQGFTITTDRPAPARATIDWMIIR